MIFLFLFSVLEARANSLSFNPRHLSMSAFKESSAGSFHDQKGNILLIHQELISQEQAKKVIASKLVLLKELLAPQKGDYPGMLEHGPECLKAAQLPAKPDANGLSWTAGLLATKQLSYGACGAMDEPYWSRRALLYCKSDGVLYDVRFFKTRKPGENEANDWLVRCK